MKNKLKNIFIINHSPNENLNYSSDYYSCQVSKFNNVKDGYEEFLQTNSDYILIIKPIRFRKKNKDISSNILACIEFLEANEHYALCQPSIVYGILSADSLLLKEQKKTHTNLNQVDDVFLLIKGNTALNFKFNPFLSDKSMNWIGYCKEINLYGFQVSRLCKNYLEVEIDTEIPVNTGKPLDAIDLINFSFQRNYFEIGIDFSYLEPVYNGTSEYSVNILKRMVEKLVENNISFQVIASSNIVERFQLEEYSANIVHPQESEKNFYHLLFIPQQIYSYLPLEKINRLCFKFVNTMLDVIALRCDYIGGPASIDIPSLLAYKYCEEVIGLTKSSARDIESYFKGNMIERSVTPILLTKEVDQSDENQVDLIEGKQYILLIGNSYKHKAIEKTLACLEDLGYNLVVIGYKPQGKDYDSRIKFYNSGQESNQQMNKLYSQAELILYPSLYEGFGLPVVAAIHLGKKILVYDSSVNRELKNFFDSNNCIHFFEKFSNLSDRINEVLKIPKIERSQADLNEFRSWKNVSEETTDLLLKVLARPIDFNKINQRIFDIVTLKIAERGIQVAEMNKTISILLNSSTLKIGLFFTWPFRKIKSFLQK